MPAKQLGNVTIDIDSEGFMTDPSQWTRDIAAAIAREEGIVELNAAHWKVLEFMRKEFQENGAVPTIRRINKSGIVSTREIYDLFPGGPAKKSAKIAGLAKPVGCV